MTKKVTKKFDEEKLAAIAAVTEDGHELSNYSKYQDDEDVVIAAVSNAGAAVEYASDRLRSDKTVVLAAVKNDPYILDMVDEKFRDDDDIMEACSGE